MTLHDIWQERHHSDFATGVQLLRQHNPGAVTKSIMLRLLQVVTAGQKPTDYELGKLSNALGKTAIPDDATPPVSTTITIAPGQTGAVRETITFKPEQPRFTSLKAKAMHKEHAHEHAQLVTAADDTQRAGHAAKIMEDIIPALDNEYDRLRAGDADDDIPTDMPPPPSGAAMLRELHSIRTRIARIKKLLKAPNDAARRAELETELETKLNRKAELENELA